MFTKHSRSRRGFTLVEIMIVIAIIALLASIAIPNWLRARKRSQATLVLENLRLLDGALDQYAMENYKNRGTADFSDLQHYLKTGTSLYDSAGKDMLGNDYGPFVVNEIPKVNSATYTEFSDVTDAGFWSPYK